MANNEPSQHDDSEQAALGTGTRTPYSQSRVSARRARLPRTWLLIAASVLALVGTAAIVVNLKQQGPVDHLQTKAVPVSTARGVISTAVGGQSPASPSAGAAATPTQSSIYFPPPYVPPAAITYGISGIKIAVSPTSFNCNNQVETFAFTATIETKPQPQSTALKGSFAGFGPQGPIGSSSGGYSLYEVAPNATTTTETFDMSLGATDSNGEYKMQFDASVPSGGVAYSNVAIVTKSC